MTSAGARTVTVRCFDVGQGSCNIIDFGKNTFGVVDCGTKGGSVESAISYLSRKCSHREAKVAFVLLTHLDEDHISGLGEMLRNDVIRQRVQRIICNEQPLRSLVSVVSRVFAARKKAGGIDGMRSSGVARNPRKSRFLKSLSVLSDSLSSIAHLEAVVPSLSDQIPVEVPGTGIDGGFLVWGPSQRLRDRAVEKISIMLDRASGDVGLGVQLEKLQRGLSDRKLVDWNAGCVVSQVCYAGVNVLFPGDANTKTWRDLERHAEGLENLKSRVVVAPHHGARMGPKGRDAEDKRIWRSLLKPEGHVLVSFGHGNRYGHPHEEALRAIHACKGETYCTQLCGDCDDDAGRAEEDLRDLFPGLPVLPIRCNTKPELKILRPGSKCCGTVAVDIRGDGKLTIACETLRDPAERTTRKGCCAGRKAGGELSRSV